MNKNVWSKGVVSAAVVSVIVPVALPVHGQAEHGVSDLFFSEYVEGSGNNKALELFNGTSQPIDLSAYTIELYSNGSVTPTNKLQLQGMVNANQTFVIKHKDASSAIQADMINSTITLFNGDDALVLKKNGEVIDTIGEVGKREEFGKDVTLVRKGDVVAGNRSFDKQEWNTNPIDTFSFLGSHSLSANDPSQVLPVVASKSGNAVQMGEKITLSTATPDATIYYTLDGSEPTIKSLTYTNPIAITTNTTIKAIAVKEGMTPSSIASFVYEISGQPSALSIHDIQGESHRSPYVGQKVAGVRGVVTAIDENDKNKGFYMQEVNPDQNPNTSEGLFVFTGKNKPSVQMGDFVEVSGVVDEFGYTKELTTTQLKQPVVVKLDGGNPLPAPILIDETQPKQVIDNDQFMQFDPKEDGIDYYESLEGMLVALDSPRVVGPTNSYGEIPVVSSKQDKSKQTKAGGVFITADQYNPERMIIDDKMIPNPPKASVGDQFTGDVRGVMSYSFGNFKLLNTEPLPKFKKGSVKQETTTVKKNTSHVTMATFNMENFYAGDKNKTEKVAEAITKNLHAPDIVGLVEMQDNDGPVDSGRTDASENFQALIDEIKKQGGPAYAFTTINPLDKQDGGQPGGNIRVGFLYDQSRITLPHAPSGAGDAKTSVSVEPKGEAVLSHNPGRIEPNHQAFKDSRKPLAAEFLFKDERFVVVANHFNSKGGDDPLFGAIQPPVRSSELQRQEQASVVNQFVQRINQTHPTAHVVAMGDFNDFEFSSPLQTLKGNELENMIETVPSDDRYTYNFEGNSQVLDHILVSHSLAKKTNVDIVHMNADFTEQDGRISDHDPVVISMQVDGKENPKPPVDYKEEADLVARKILDLIFHHDGSFLDLVKEINQLIADRVKGWFS